MVDERKWGKGSVFGTDEACGPQQWRTATVRTFEVRRRCPVDSFSHVAVEARARVCLRVYINTRMSVYPCIFMDV